MSLVCLHSIINANNSPSEGIKVEAVCNLLEPMYPSKMRLSLASKRQTSEFITCNTDRQLISQGPLK